MILAEKIILLRKKNGWSQEELAEQLSVSRQSVSKWESGQSVPDLNKILALSQIFGVTVDYLVKDEMGSEDVQYGEDIPMESMRRMTVEEAGRFLADEVRAAKQTAIGVSLCILSPVLLLFLGGMQEGGRIPITEDLAGGLGVAVLLFLVAAAVAVFIKTGLFMERWKFIKEGEFLCEYGVEGIVRDRKEKYAGTYGSAMVWGVVLCITGVVPLMIAAGFSAPDEILVSCVCILLILVAAGCFLLVNMGMVQDSYSKILKEGDYTEEGKRRSRRNETVGTIYWCTVTAVFLGVSLYMDNWDKSWIIWPCAGVLFAAVMGILSLLEKEEK